MFLDYSINEQPRDMLRWFFVTQRVIVRIDALNLNQTCPHGINRLFDPIHQYRAFHY